MTTTPLLHFANVRRQYKVPGGTFREPKILRAVDGVTLSVRRGETLGLVGESGCGKSTLARLAVRMEPPTSGRVLLDGTDLWDQPSDDLLTSLPRRVSMIFQDPFSSLNPRKSIAFTVGEPLAINRPEGARTAVERRERVAELLALVGLTEEHGRRYPHEFSGGQRQRVAIARALALSPDLVVCDEPVSALDVSIQAQVLNLMRELQNRLSLAYLFISHDLSVVAHVAERVAVMYLGRIVELAPARELVRTPLHPYTRALLAAVPRPDPALAGHPPVPLAGETPSPVNPPSGCPFHPRCPERMAVCANARPAFLPPDPARPERTVACYLYSQAAEDDVPTTSLAASDTPAPPAP